MRSYDEINKLLLLGYKNYCLNIISDRISQVFIKGNLTSLMCIKYEYVSKNENCLLLYL